MPAAFLLYASSYFPRGVSATDHVDAASQLPAPSPDGALIAIIASCQLHVRSARTAEDVQIYDLPSGFNLSCRFIRWYGLQPNGPHPNAKFLLLADDSKIMIYDTTRPQLYAEIGGATNMTKLADVDFGWTPNEVMVFSDFGFKLQIWSLPSKRAVEIKDPKPISPNHSYRPTTGHLAVLTRPAAHDILMIIAPQSYEVLSTFELSTVDALGIQYSPDGGNWLAIYDAASAGCRVPIHTADGHHFKTYMLPQDELNLGVRCIKWSPSGNYLAVGDHEGSVTLLGKNTFAPRLRFFHPTTIEVLNGMVWQEELGPSGSRSYVRTNQHATSPSHESFQATKKRSSGVTFMEFNYPRGDLLASTSSDTPSTLWIHSVDLASKPATTALIHHSPIKALLWHPSVEDLLLVQCAIAEPIVYMWRACWSEPRIVCLSSLKAPLGKLKAAWLASDGDRVRFILSSTEQSAIKQLTEEGENCPESLGHTGPEAMFDEGQSFDMSPDRLLADEQSDVTSAVGLSTELGQNLDVEDTFQYRHQK
ncbi:MAG: hypothetical protein Q9209_005911 [Squamulea sp. 1 TL-2023]